MSTLTLVGCIHDDPRMEERMHAMLNSEVPTHLTLELCPEDIELFRKRYDALFATDFAEQLQAYRIGKRHAALTRLFRAALLQNFLIPHAYAEEHGIPVHCIDAPFTAQWRRGTSLIRRFYQEWSRYLSQGGITARRFGKDIDDQYHSMRLLLEHDHDETVSRYFFRTEGAWDLRNNRDQVPCTALLDLLRTAEHAHIVHVCGIVHLVQDAKERTLYSKVRSQSPMNGKNLILRRKTLLDYDPSDRA